MVLITYLCFAEGGEERNSGVSHGPHDGARASAPRFMFIPMQRKGARERLGLFLWQRFDYGSTARSLRHACPTYLPTSPSMLRVFLSSLP